jgi:hypothetical protein
MKNTVSEDRTQFDGLPPAVIQRHLQNWIEEQGYHLPNLKPTDLRLRWRARHCIASVSLSTKKSFWNLLRFSSLAIPQASYDDRIGVKVLDVECHADSEDYEPLFDEAWLWAAPKNLPEIWFKYQELSTEEFRDTDGFGRPVIL